MTHQGAARDAASACFRPSITRPSPLISAISQYRLECNIGGMVTNLLAYADDMVMLAPSWHAMQALINLLHMWCSELDIECNTKKTVCMIFKPRSKTRYITDDCRPK